VPMWAHYPRNEKPLTGRPPSWEARRARDRPWRFVRPAVASRPLPERRKLSCTQAVLRQGLAGHRCCNDFAGARKRYANRPATIRDRYAPGYDAAVPTVRVHHDGVPCGAGGDSCLVDVRDPPAVGRPSRLLAHPFDDEPLCARAVRRDSPDLERIRRTGIRDGELSTVGRERCVHHVGPPGKRHAMPVRAISIHHVDVVDARPGGGACDHAPVAREVERDTRPA
jgi:hypothetical protein